MMDVNLEKATKPKGEVPADFKCHEGTTPQKLEVRLLKTSGAVQLYELFTLSVKRMHECHKKRNT
jgi:hypothetical protein